METNAHKMTTNPVVERQKRKIAEWANTQDNIRAIVVVGSQVRSDHPADEWSDLDVQVFCVDPYCLLTDTRWLGTLGKTWVVIPIQKEKQQSELLVVFEGGQKADFHFFEIAALQEMVETRSLLEVYQRGYQCLVDKEGWVKKLAPPSKMYLEKKPPSDAEFRRVIELFWYEALAGAKMIRRRELWLVKVGDVLGLKQRLLRMLEWQTQAGHGWMYDAWYGGKNLKEWAKPGIWENMNLLFSHFDVPDSWRGLIETAKLFEQAAIEVAGRLGYEYPTEMSQSIKGVIERLYAEDGKSG